LTDTRRMEAVSFIFDFRQKVRASSRRTLLRD
jgi:hypothetical protein